MLRIYFLNSQIFDNFYNRWWCYFTLQIWFFKN